jgi:hypothetical protein
VFDDDGQVVVEVGAGLAGHAHTHRHDLGSGYIFWPQ